jgi:hypothetical protein
MAAAQPNGWRRSLDLLTLDHRRRFATAGYPTNEMPFDDPSSRDRRRSVLALFLRSAVKDFDGCVRYCATLRCFQRDAINLTRS